MNIYDVKFYICRVFLVSCLCNKIHMYIKILIASCLMLLFASCSALSSRESSLFVEKEMDKTINRNLTNPNLGETDSSEVDSSKIDSGVPSYVANALVSGVVGDTNRSALSDERFDVSVNNVPAKIFFLNLVADSGVNVVTDPEVDGFISLELKNVTVQEVLNITRDVYGYEYSWGNSTYTIYSRKIRTEIFSINYPDIQRVGVTDTSVLIGKIGSNGSGANTSSNSNGGNGRSSTDESANLLGYLGSDSVSGSESLTPGTRVQTLNKTDFWPGLHTTLLSMVGEGEGRLVVTNPQSGLVVVKAFPKEIKLVRNFLERSELNVVRQVVLETKILEVTLKDEFDSGINWSAISGQLSLSQNITGVDSVSEVVFGSAGASDVLFSSVLDVVDITKLISLLNRQGNVQVLSSPRISTVNNQKAVIRVGSDEFFVTGLSSSTTSNASSVTSTPDIELSSFFSGISLDVTPQISKNDDVIIHVHPLVSTVVDQQKELTVGDESFSLPLALRDVRESDSIVRAKNGQVVVLGGLMQESSSYIDTKRGGLGRIPILNIFFKHTEEVKVKTELVILMRPIVIKNEAWDKEISTSHNQIKKISNELRSREE